MPKLTEYQDRHRVTANIARQKAMQVPGGVSDWPFMYRGQQVIVTARREGDRVRTSTTHVKNKG